MCIDPHTGRFHPPGGWYVFADEAARVAAMAELPRDPRPPPDPPDRRDPYSYAPKDWEGD